MIHRHKNSALAEFHRALAGRCGFELDEFAEKVRRVALDAQKAAGKASAPVGEDYVKALLYGRKPIGHRWRVAVAKVAGLPVAEYERQTASLRHSRHPESSPLGAARDGVLPVSSWPHVKWRMGNTAPRQIASRLYGLSKDGLDPRFSVVPVLWHPPAGFSGYADLRDRMWGELREFYSRMKKEPPIPRPLWHVRRIVPEAPSRVAMELLRGDYRDILVTGSLQGLDRRIRTDSGEQCTVRQWLASHWNPGDTSQPVLDGARHLVVNVIVLTRDGSVVVSRQGPDNPDSGGSWATSTSIIVNPVTDSDSRQTPDLARVVSRGCKEELGVDTDGHAVRWLTVAAGLKFGSFALFGVLESPWSREEIRAAVARNVQLAKEHVGRACEVVEVEFLDATPKKVARRLLINDYRPYLELGLALLLWRKGEAEIEEGIAEGA